MVDIQTEMPEIIEFLKSVAVIKGKKNISQKDDLQKNDLQKNDLQKEKETKDNAED